MKKIGLRIFSVMMTCAAGVWMASAQDAQKPAYLNTSLTAEQRATDLVSRMTLEEKATNSSIKPVPFPG